MEKLQAIVLQLAEANLKSNDYFIEQVTVSAGGGHARVAILLGGDHGVTIDDCAALSRAVGNALEEQDLMDDRYTLEVSSPGLDHPLTSLRQYKKNVGRRVKISGVEGKEVKGILKEVSGDQLLLDKEIKKGKKITYESIQMDMKHIKKAIVQVSFK